ncbi:MAG: CBS domain-containing protein [Oligoflexia bacterium]|nr:CBS domain-containing protein [Oligoflexia bacterium]
MGKNQKLNVSVLTADSIMTTQVIKFNLHVRVRKAMETLLEKKISGAPVVDDSGKLVSVVSEADLMRFAAQGGLDHTLGAFNHGLVKTKDLVTVERQAPFSDVFKIFITKPIKRIIVVDEVGRLQGIIARSDVLRAFLESEDKPKD